MKAYVAKIERHSGAGVLIEDFNSLRDAKAFCQEQSDNPETTWVSLYAQYGGHLLRIDWERAGEVVP